MVIICAHCSISKTVYRRHICEAALRDWSRLADPQLYGWLMPYTPTMRLSIEEAQREVQTS